MLVHFFVPLTNTQEKYGKKGCFCAHVCKGLSTPCQGEGSKSSSHPGSQELEGAHRPCWLCFPPSYSPQVPSLLGAATHIQGGSYPWVNLSWKCLKDTVRSVLSYLLILKPVHLTTKLNCHTRSVVYKL